MLYASSAWASLLLVQLHWAMRRPRSAERATSIVPTLFFVPFYQSYTKQPNQEDYRHKIILAMLDKCRLSSVVRLLMLFFVASLTTNCSAKTTKSKKSAEVEYADSVLRNAIGDSACNLLMNAKVSSMLIVDNNGDTVYTDEKKLMRDDLCILRYLLQDPDMVTDSMPVHALVIPCIRFKFSKTKNEVIYLNLDFGLREWTLTDIDGKQVARYSLSKYEMLRFCHYLYPENEFITERYNASRK